MSDAVKPHVQLLCGDYSEELGGECKLSNGGRDWRHNLHGVFTTGWRNGAAGSGDAIIPASGSVAGRKGRNRRESS